MITYVRNASGTELKPYKLVKIDEVTGVVTAWLSPFWATAYDTTWDEDSR